MYSDNFGPAITPAEAAALHDRPESVAWFAVPNPSGPGVIARAHTEAHDSGRLLPGHITAASLDELRGLLSADLVLEMGKTPGMPPGGLGLFI